MTTQFDATFVYTGPISEEVQAEHAKEIETSRNMLSKLANAKLHAGNELQRWVLSCNRFIWGEVPAELRQPSPDEIAWLLGQLPAESHERVMKESRLAAEQRHLIAMLEAAEAQAQAQMEAEREEAAKIEAEMRAQLEAQQAEQARKEAESTLWTEFEAFDLAGKEARFRAWLASQRR